MQSNKEEITALIELNDELENYFQNTIIPQLFVDAQLVLRKFTPPAMKQFNLKAAHIGRPLSEIADNFRFPTILDNIQYVIDSGEILEKEIQTTDMRWFQMNVLPYLIRKENKANGVIITFVDITERISDLKEQEKMIAEHELLLDTITHDLSNPILAMSMTIEMLKKLPEKGMEGFPSLLKNAESSLMNMKQMIQELVQSRWQEQRYQAEEELLDLGNILEDVRLTLSTQIQATNAIIKTEIGASEVVFARRKLRSVIHNLVNNALKYASKDRIPKIYIKSYKEPGYLVISVSDNGIGISPENQRLIFKKYHRVKSSVEGDGVGLYLVSSILKTAGGKITVESELDKGSTFRLFLPVEEEAKDEQ
jgi:two-component system phosphate regulon sensor histidine kinase PhoR